MTFEEVESYVRHKFKLDNTWKCVELSWDHETNLLHYTVKKDDSDDAMIQGTILVNTAVH